MAKMYPKSITEYMPTDSERIVYQELKNQLPDSFDVFYSLRFPIKSLVNLESNRPPNVNRVFRVVAINPHFQAPSIFAP